MTNVNVFSLLFIVVTLLVFHDQETSCTSEFPDIGTQVKSKEKAKPEKSNGGALNSLYYTLDTGQPTFETVAICFGCTKAMDTVLWMLKSGTSVDSLAEMAIPICALLQLFDEPVCRGLVNVFKETVGHITQRTPLNGKEICGILLGASCVNPDGPFFNWTIELPVAPNTAVKRVPEPKYERPVIRILHLTDIHYDPMYTVGADTSCGKPLCCEPSDFPASKPDHESGKWGSYESCDMPMVTLDSMVDHIVSTHKIDMVYWTGDNTQHDYYRANREKHVKSIRTLGRLLKTKFGSVPVYPCVGNHDSLPMYSFPPVEVKGNLSISWIYDVLDEVWSAWLPQDTTTTIKKGGYYSVQISKWFKIISINSNFCAHLNFWLLLNCTDPADQLAWLVDELRQSELVGQKVHILSHFPPGKFDCIKAWSDNYYRIINRFKNTVTGQFFGHTHVDEFEIFYEDNLTPRPKATNMAYIAPSVTTYEDVNPSYRIYTVDGNYPGCSWEVLDHETYFLNLSKANLNPNNNAQWELSYSAKDYYGLKNLKPDEWSRLVQRFEVDDSLFQKFYRVFKTRSDYNFVPCTGECKEYVICAMLSARSNDPELCRRLKKNLSLN